MDEITLYNVTISPLFLVIKKVQIQFQHAASQQWLYYKNFLYTLYKILQTYTIDYVVKH